MHSLSVFWCCPGSSPYTQDEAWTCTGPCPYTGTEHTTSYLLQPRRDPGSGKQAQQAHNCSLPSEEGSKKPKEQRELKAGEELTVQMGTGSKTSALGPQELKFPNACYTQCLLSASNIQTLHLRLCFKTCSVKTFEMAFATQKLHMKPVLHPERKPEPCWSPQHPPAPSFPGSCTTSTELQWLGDNLDTISGGTTENTMGHPKELLTSVLKYSQHLEDATR